MAGHVQKKLLASSFAPKREGPYIVKEAIIVVISGLPRLDQNNSAH